MSSKKSKKAEPLIYCGPSLPRGILPRYKIYRNGLPKHLEEHFESCPSIARLFVSLEQLSRTVEAINASGTAENVWYKQVVDYIKGGVK